MHSLGIVQWDSTRRDHPGYPGRVSGMGPVNGCCAFAHNICGSQPVVPNGMPNMSKPLSSELFINPRCPPGVVPVEAVTNDVRPGEAMIMLEREAPAAVPGIDISEEGEHLSIAEVGLGNEPDFLLRVTGESEEANVSSGG